MCVYDLTVGKETIGKERGGEWELAGFQQGFKGPDGT